MNKLSESAFRQSLCEKTVSYTVDPLYSERVGVAKSVNNNRIFTINVFNMTIN
jgi:hypothetical protein